MKSLRQIYCMPEALPLIADDITELHAARLLLLFKICGQSGRIEGLTKLAKLDFFVRYPAFFARAAKVLKKTVSIRTTQIDSEMVRHHYGPWDKRYYSVLPFLESHKLIKVSKEGSTFIFSLTEEGQTAAKTLGKRPEFSMQTEHMKEVKRLFGHWKGGTLKDLVYEVFDEEVGQKLLGEVIQ